MLIVVVLINMVLALSIATNSLGDHASVIERKESSHKAQTIDENVDALQPNKFIVDWDGPYDVKNPMNWPASNRWLQISLISLLTFITPLGSSMFAPGIGLMDEQFHNRNDVLSALSLSVYLFGFVFGPLVAAPLSETFGRLPVYHIGNLLFIVFSVACGVSSNLNMFIGFRFLMGTFGSVPATIGGGTVADLIAPQERGKAVGLWTLGPMLGPVIGPAAGGWLSIRVSWRWNFYVIAMFQGFLSILCLIFLRESYAPVLLRKKTQRLRKQTGNVDLKSKLEDNVTMGERFRLAIVRPAKMLMTPIVFILCLDVAMVYAYLYILFTTFTTAFMNEYGFSVGQAGLVYLGIGPGLLGSLAIVVIFSDRYVIRKTRRGEMKPEYRLPPLIPGAFILPAGLFWYGWALKAHTHWMVPIIGTILIGMGLNFTFVPVQTYFVDAYTRYAASAIAAGTVCRSLLGAVLPLAGDAMFRRLGYGWGSSVLAFIALALAPAPFLIIRYGERIRTSKRFSVKL